MGVGCGCIPLASLFKYSKVSAAIAKPTKNRDFPVFLIGILLFQKIIFIDAFLVYGVK